MEANLLLEGLTLGDVENHENLYFVRIFGDNKFDRDMLILDEALETKQFKATETGTVETLQLDNNLDKLVFIACGMIFEGATQNRAAQYPAMVPAYTENVQFPVRCAEKRQGLRGDSNLETSDTIIMASARTGRIDQDTTWTRISDTRDITQMSSTEDYASSIKSANLEDYINILGEPKEKQLGYVAAINNGSTGFYADIFGNNELYGKLHKRLHESIAAVARYKFHSNTSEMRKDMFEDFIDTAKTSNLTEEDLDNRLAGKIYTITESIEGSVLVYDEKPVQISLRKE